MHIVCGDRYTYAVIDNPPPPTRASLAATFQFVSVLFWFFFFFFGGVLSLSSACFEKDRESFNFHTSPRDTIRKIQDTKFKIHILRLIGMKFS